MNIILDNKYDKNNIGNMHKRVQENNKKSILLQIFFIQFYIRLAKYKKY